MKVLINNSVSDEIVQSLQQDGFQVLQVKVATEQLAAYTQKNQVDVLVIKKTIGFTKELIDDLAHLKAIVFASTTVELEIIDYVKSNGVKAIWAESSLSNATAELVFAHLFGACRLLQESNRNMPLEGDTSFGFLQESYQNGIELAGKTLGILGMNQAGELVAQKALALGMHVLYHDPLVKQIANEYILPNSLSFKVQLNSSEKLDVLQQSHFLTVHTPFYHEYPIDKEDLDQAQNLLGVINCAYPKAINEVALVDLVNQEKLLFAGIDRFEQEPTPAIQVLMQPAFSLSPNINGSTDVSEALLWDEILQKMFELVDK